VKWGLLIPREVQVVALVADGLSNREVVRELRLSKHAIQNISSGPWISWGSKAAVELVLYPLSLFVSSFELYLSLFWHFPADDHGVSGLGIDPRGDRLAAARNRVCVLLLVHNAVLDDLGGRRRHLAANRRRRQGCRLRRSDRLLFGRTAGKEQNRQQKEDGPEFSHRQKSETTRSI